MNIENVTLLGLKRNIILLQIFPIADRLKIVMSVNFTLTLKLDTDTYLFDKCRVEEGKKRTLSKNCSQSDIRRIAVLYDGFCSSCSKL